MRDITNIPHKSNVGDNPKKFPPPLTKNDYFIIEREISVLNGVLQQLTMDLNLLRDRKISLHHKISIYKKSLHCVLKYMKTAET